MKHSIAVYINIILRTSKRWFFLNNLKDNYILRLSTRVKWRKYSDVNILICVRSEGLNYLSDFYDSEIRERFEAPLSLLGRVSIRAGSSGLCKLHTYERARLMGFRVPTSLSTANTRQQIYTSPLHTFFIYTCKRGMVRDRGRGAKESRKTSCPE